MITPSIVLDCGSYTTKIGVSGNTAPSVIYPSNFPGCNSFVSESFINDYTEFERYFESILLDNLQISPSDWPLVFAVPCGAGRRYRENLAEIFFENFNSPGVFFEESGVLAMHATAGVSCSNIESAFNSTACILEIGHSFTTLSAVVEGYLVESEKFPIAGKDITDMYVDAVSRREGFQTAITEQERKIRKIATKAKEEFGFVAEDVLAVHTEFSRNFARHKKSIHGLEFGIERFLASEILFDGKLNSKKFPGLPDVIEELVMSRVPVDYRKKLIGNFVLCGGSSLLSGIEKRLKKELPKNLSAEFFPWGDSGLQGHAVWTGGSVVAESPGFEERVIWKTRWEEEGSRIFSINEY